MFYAQSRKHTPSSAASLVCRFFGFLLPIGIVQRTEKKSD